MPKLYLIPNRINEDKASFFSADVTSVIKTLRLFFVEEGKSARRLLKDLDPEFPFGQCEFIDLNEHTKRGEVQTFIKSLNKDAGIISESGCPCVADPGADLVLLAHQKRIDVVPLIGPSSILLALMASGLNGQNFAFNGYLPKESAALQSKLKSLEKKALSEGQTQIFMETPYRNGALVELLLKSCDPNLYLCVALDIAGPDQMIKTQKISEWKKRPPLLPKKPALFIISKSI